MIRENHEEKESMHYMFSIIVPVYNVEKYLDECIRSLLKQTYSSLEIILIDDGSTDQSGIICDNYSAKYNNVKSIHQKNQGQSKARNEGVKIAKGKWLMFVDSDDFIVENTCEIIANYIKKYDVDIIIGDMLNDPCLLKRKKMLTDKVMLTHEYLERSLIYNMYDIVPWLKIINYDFFVKKKLFFLEGYYYEDQEFTLRLLLQEARILKIYFPFYFYRENLSSTTHKFEKKKGEDCINILKSMICEIENGRYPNRVLNSAANVIAMSVYHLSNVYLNMKEEDQKYIYAGINKKLRSYGRKTNLLTYRMKVQNRLFLYFPQFLKLLFIIKNSRG